MRTTRVTLAVATAFACWEAVATAAPVIVSSPPALSTDTTPTIAWRSSGESRFSWTLLTGERTVSSGNTRSTSVTLGPLGNGTYRFLVRERDSDDSAGTPPFTIVATPPPGAPQFTGLPAAISREAQPTVAWRGQPGATFTLTVLRGGTVVASPPPTTAGSLRIGPLQDGVYTLSLVQTDALGRTSPAALSQAFTVDTTPPPPPTLSLPGPVVTATPPQVQITAEADATISWAITGPATRSGAGAVADFSRLPDGAYTLTARATDRLRAVSAPATLSVTIDRVAPAMPIILSVPVSSPDPAPLVSWRGEPGARFRWVVTDGARQLQSGETTQTSVRLGELPDGAFTLEVVQLDVAGNASAPLRATFRIARPAPPPPPPPPAPVVPPVLIAAPASSGPRLIVQPFGVVRPWTGLRITKARPLLRWRVPANRAKPRFYNVQIYAGRRKIHSAFTTTNLYRVPSRILKPTRRYYWQIWAYRPGTGYDRSPIAVSYFTLRKGK